MLPTLWFRNTWRFSGGLAPSLFLDGEGVVHVPGGGPRARTVPIRHAYVPLIERALAGHADAGLRKTDLVVANCPAAVNVATPTLDRIASADGVRHRIQTARLRHTWLVAAMCAPVSMADLMQAAGIRSARTLTELLEHCPTPEPAQVRDTYTTLAALARGGGNPTVDPTTAPADVRGGGPS